MVELSEHREEEGAPAPGQAALKGLRAPLTEIVEEIGRFDIRGYEGWPAAELVTDLQPIAAGLVERAIAAIDEVIGETVARCAGASEAAAPLDRGASTDAELDDRFEFALDSLVDQTDPTIQAIDDIAFVARLEFRQRRSRLAALTAERSRIDILSECERGLRGVRKSLSALDQIMSDTLGLPPGLGYESELQTSLRVRRCYARFRRQILEGGEPGYDEVYPRLRAAGTVIAVLVGRDIYPELRIRDRLQIRELQDRILSWLRTGRDDLAGGIRLYQDLAAFVGMLTEVNNRQELVAHDAALVEDAHDQLTADAIDGERPIPPELFRRLDALRGLDDEVDELLDAAEPRDRAAWKSLLARLRARLCASFSQR